MNVVRADTLHGVAVPARRTRQPSNVSSPKPRPLARAPGRKPYREATLAERRDVILDHFRLIQRDDADAPRAMLSKLRTFTGWYTHGLPNGGELRRRIASLESPEAFLEAVEHFFETHAARVAA